MIAQVQLDGIQDEAEPLLLESSIQVEEGTGLQMEDAVLHPTMEEQAQMILSNRSRFTQVASKGLELGRAVPATVIQPNPCASEDLLVQQCVQTSLLTKTA